LPKVALAIVGFIVVAATVAVLVVGPIVAVLVFPEGSFDPATPEILSGVTVVDGDVVVVLASCSRGPVELVSLALDHGLQSKDEPLWTVEASPEGTLEVGPREILEVRIGTAPEGMVETVQFEDEIPDDQALQVSIQIGRNETGLFFETNDLTSSAIYSRPQIQRSLGEFAHDVETYCKRSGSSSSS
jgi:hypothetical protein